MHLSWETNHGGSRFIEWFAKPDYPVRNAPQLADRIPIGSGQPGERINDWRAPIVSEFLEAHVEDVNRMQIEADQAVSAMATGRSHNLHEMMLALDRRCLVQIDDEGTKQGC